MGVGGGNSSRRIPDQGNGGRRVDSRSRREAAVDESRKETAVRVARNQADKYIGGTRPCYSYRQLLQLVRTWPFFLFSFFFWCSDPPCFCFSSVFLLVLMK